MFLKSTFLYNIINASLLLISLCFLSSCIKPNPNLDSEGEDVLTSNVVYSDESVQNYQDTVYVPIYSDIYSRNRQQSTLLTATLSIRSTSLTDTTYINSLTYYNTDGDMVRTFIEKTLVLAPMQTIDYVIDQEDDSGGSGANFLLTWGARKNTKPIIQAVMISKLGQHGLSFITDGISIKN